MMKNSHQSHSTDPLVFQHPQVQVKIRVWTCELGNSVEMTLSIMKSTLSGGSSCTTSLYIVLQFLRPDRAKGKGGSKTVFPGLDQHAPSERQNFHRPVEALPCR